jgi:hypothetical protein
LDVELVEALDLGAREEELCTKGYSETRDGGHSLEDLEAAPVSHEAGLHVFEA